MTKGVSIIFVEDVPVEAVAVEEVLRKAGLMVQLRRVETRKAFLHELELHPPDVILSDHGLPSFDGFAALTLAREKCPQVPFLFVTDTLAREATGGKRIPGVTDYVPKSQLHLLAPAIHRALSGAGQFPPESTPQETRRRELAEKIMALVEEYERLGCHLPICSNCKKIRDQQGAWEPMEDFFMKRAGLTFTHGFCPDCGREFLQR